MRLTNTKASLAILTLVVGGLNLGCGKEEPRESEVKKHDEAHDAPASHAGPVYSTAATGAGVGTGEMTGTGTGRTRSNMGVAGFGENTAKTDADAKKSGAAAPTTAPAEHHAPAH